MGKTFPTVGSEQQCTGFLRKCSSEFPVCGRVQAEAGRGHRCVLGVRSSGDLSGPVIHHLPLPVLIGLRLVSSSRLGLGDQRSGFEHFDFGQVTFRF